MIVSYCNGPDPSSLDLVGKGMDASGAPSIVVGQISVWGFLFIFLFAGLFFPCVSITNIVVCCEGEHFLIIVQNDSYHFRSTYQM